MTEFEAVHPSCEPGLKNNLPENFVSCMAQSDADIKVLYIK
ncbi:MAG: hypothetical protein WCO02_03200 [Bacteroidota bacterium]